MKSKIAVIGLIAIVGVLNSGCIHFSSYTTHETYTNGVVSSKDNTIMYTTSFFDSTVKALKVRNSPSVTSTNEHSSGTSIGQVDQSTSSSNAVQLINAAASGIMQGMAQGLK